jgi:hypothetical protein
MISILDQALRSLPLVRFRKMKQSEETTLMTSISARKNKENKGMISTLTLEQEKRPSPKRTTPNRIIMKLEISWILTS